MPSVLAALAVLTLALSAASEPAAPAGAVPQYNASLVVLALAAHDERGWSAGGQVGLRPELFLGRRDATSVGAGPFLEVSAHLANRGVAALLGGGASLLLPLGDSNALVPSLGGYGTFSEALGLQPGLCAGLFFGARQFNARSFFDGAWGLRLDVRYGLGSSREAMVTLGGQLDLSLAAFLLSWVFQ